VSIYRATLYGQQIIELTLSGQIHRTISAKANSDRFETNEDGKLAVTLTTVAVTPAGDIHTLDDYRRDYIHPLTDLEIRCGEPSAMRGSPFVMHDGSPVNPTDPPGVAGDLWFEQTGIRHYRAQVQATAIGPFNGRHRIVSREGLPKCRLRLFAAPRDVQIHVDVNDRPATSSVTSSRDKPCPWQYITLRNIRLTE
jgi:hypothetical protein